MKIKVKQPRTRKFRVRVAKVPWSVTQMLFHEKDGHENNNNRR